MKGCRYNARFKVCSPGGDNIDEQCATLDNKCLTRDEYKKKTGNEYVSVEVAPKSEIKTQRTSNRKPLTPLPYHFTISPALIADGLTYISGPINWFYFKGKVGEIGPEKSYHFFGDAHFSKKNNCEDAPYNQTCTKIQPDLIAAPPSKQCYDITYLLKSIFEKAVADKTYTDFYLEFPYQTKESDMKLTEISKILTNEETENEKYYREDDIREFVAKEIRKSHLTDLVLREYKKLDYINNLYVLFYPCLKVDKSECPYLPYVRSHYTDPRLSINSHKIRTLNSFIHIAINYIIEEIRILMVVSHKKFDFMIKEIPEIRNKIIADITSKSNFINELLLPLTASGMSSKGKVDINRDLFNAYILSENFSKDVTKILNDIFPKAKLVPQSFREYFDLPIGPILRDLDNISLLDAINQLKTDIIELSVEREKMNVHRIKAQLDALRKDNIIIENNNIADLIIDFLFDTYQSFNISSIYRNWQKLYQDFLVPLSKNVVNFDKFVNYVENHPSGCFADLISSDSILMDGYLLARMFRTFSDTKKKRNPHVPSSQVFVYAGAKHTGNYAQFFTDYLKMPMLDFYQNPSNKHFIRCLVDSNFKSIFPV